MFQKRVTLDELVVYHNIYGPKTFEASVDVTVRGRALVAELRPPTHDLTDVLPPLLDILDALVAEYPLTLSLEFRLDVSTHADVVHERFFSYMDSMAPTKLPGASSLVGRLIRDKEALRWVFEDLLHMRIALSELYDQGVHNGDGRAVPVESLRITLGSASMHSSLALAGKRGALHQNVFHDVDASYGDCVLQAIIDTVPTFQVGSGSGVKVGLPDRAIGLQPSLNTVEGLRRHCGLQARRGQPLRYEDLVQLMHRLQWRQSRNGKLYSVGIRLWDLSCNLRFSPSPEHCDKFQPKPNGTHFPFFVDIIMDNDHAQLWQTPKAAENNIKRAFSFFEAYLTATGYAVPEEETDKRRFLHRLFYDAQHLQPSSELLTGCARITRAPRTVSKSRSRSWYGLIRSARSSFNGYPQARSAARAPVLADLWRPGSVQSRRRGWRALPLEGGGDFRRALQRPADTHERG